MDCCCRSFPKENVFGIRMKKVGIVHDSNDIWTDTDKIKLPRRKLPRAI